MSIEEGPLTTQRSGSGVTESNVALEGAQGMPSLEMESIPTTRVVVESLKLKVAVEESPGGNGTDNSESSVPVPDNFALDHEKGF